MLGGRTWCVGFNYADIDRVKKTRNHSLTISNTKPHGSGNYSSCDFKSQLTITNPWSHRMAVSSSLEIIYNTHPSHPSWSANLGGTTVILVLWPLSYWNCCRWAAEPNR